jgi:pilus assembly protein Flp/PilA
MKPQNSSPHPNHLASDESGATATEYVMLVAFIAFALIAAVTIFGTALNNYYLSLASSISSILA